MGKRGRPSRAELMARDMNRAVRPFTEVQPVNPASSYMPPKSIETEFQIDNSYQSSVASPLPDPIPVFRHPETIPVPVSLAEPETVVYLTPRVSIRRVNLVDLVDMGTWLVGRLREKYAELTDKFILGWLHSCLESPEYLFIRTANAVALAQLIKNPLDYRPSVKEIFVLCMTENLDEADWLYEDITQWAKNLGARNVTVRQLSDVPNDKIKRRVKGIQEQITWVARIND